MAHRNRNAWRDDQHRAKAKRARAATDIVRMERRRSRRWKTRTAA